MAAHLPVELAREILTLAAAFLDSPLTTPDYATLRSAALVSKAWCVLAQELLWSHVVLRRDRHPFFDTTEIILSDDDAPAQPRAKRDPTLREKSDRAARRRMRDLKAQADGQTKAYHHRLLSECSATRWIKGTQALKRRRKGAAPGTRTLVLDGLDSYSGTGRSWIELVGMTLLARTAGPKLRTLVLYYVKSDCEVLRDRSLKSLWFPKFKRISSGDPRDLPGIERLELYNCSLRGQLTGESADRGRVEHR